MVASVEKSRIVFRADFIPASPISQPWRPPGRKSVRRKLAIVMRKVVFNFAPFSSIIGTSSTQAKNEPDDQILRSTRDRPAGGRGLCEGGSLNHRGK